MEKTNISNLLQQFFTDFEPKLQEQIAQIGEIKSFEADAQLLRPGQYFKSVQLIVEGSVKIFRMDEEGNEFLMYYLNAGEACALSLVCALKSEASQVLAKTVEPTKIITIPIGEMDKLMQNYTSWYYFVLSTYRNRFEELLSVIDGVAFKKLDEQLEFYLKRESERLKSKEIHLTHQEIANDLNSSREVISRLLKKMEQRSLISLGRNTITLRF